MATVREEINPTLIPNTIMHKRIYNGVHNGYTVKPISGYVLHDQARDWTDTDMDTMEDVLYRGYTRGEASFGVNYDFDNTTIIDGYTAYGSREFFARPESEAPADQIFGGVGNDHEVM